MLEKAVLLQIPNRADESNRERWLFAIDEKLANYGDPAVAGFGHTHFRSIPAAM